ncbi:MAG: hypothetical protein ACRD3O_00245 [Terriglobia bacterium]
MAVALSSAGEIVLADEEKGINPKASQKANSKGKRQKSKVKMDVSKAVATTKGRDKPKGPVC